MKTTPPHIPLPQQRGAEPRPPAWRQPRTLLWVAIGLVTLGFHIALEFVARHYGQPGPITVEAQEVIFAPRSGPLLYGGLALTMVVLTWRQRLIALCTAVGIDIVFVLVRLIVGADLSFGNGALWVILGIAVLGLARRTGRERSVLLKGSGLGLLLVFGHKTGDTWLLITSKTRPLVLDQYVATADHALANPSWLVGRLVEATSPFSGTFLHLVYGQLPLAAALVGLYQLRHVAAERRFPAHHLVRTFLAIGLLGPAIYMIFPVVGPLYAFGPDGAHWAVADIWPHTFPAIGVPHQFPFDEITPRNCMPSLHTAWAITLFIHTREGSRAMRWAGTFWLVGTLTATLGFGYHYGVDLLAGTVFALSIEATMRAFARGWDRRATLMAGYGTAVLTMLLLSYRYLPTHMAARPWAFGPLLLLLTGSVVLLYVHTTKQWGPKAAPPPPRPSKAGSADPQPELA
ncbi:phosphatase PAP2 family protein [Streptomyces fractus]|uniref:phosphatase PAP2 family protein n=1 Tax=Streptomyces fractus TaxID=641806 RepID=UPI003CEED435